MKVKSIDRYHAVMQAAAQISVFLMQDKGNAKPMSDAVTLAFELEEQVHDIFATEPE